MINIQVINHDQQNNIKMMNLKFHFRRTEMHKYRHCLPSFGFRIRYPQHRVTYISYTFCINKMSRFLSVHPYPHELPGNTSRISGFGAWIHPFRCWIMHWNMLCLCVTTRLVYSYSSLARWWSSITDFWFILDGFVRFSLNPSGVYRDGWTRDLFKMALMHRSQSRRCGIVHGNRHCSLGSGNICT